MFTKNLPHILRLDKLCFNMSQYFHIKYLCNFTLEVQISVWALL